MHQDVAISLAGLEAAQDRLEAWTESVGVPPLQALRLRLVVEELVANLVEHAAWDGPPAPARLEVTWRDGALEVALEDAAVPFDPLAAPHPAAPSLEDDRIGGLGLALVRKMTIGLRYQRLASGWNRTAFQVNAGKVRDGYG